MNAVKKNQTFWQKAQEKIAENFWNGLISMGFTIAILLLKDIARYEKDNYDWQHKVENRVANIENSQATHADLIYKGQIRQDDTDNTLNKQQRISFFLCAKMGIDIDKIP